MFDQQKQTAKRLQLRKRLLTINKRNIIQWNINRDNSFHSRGQVLRVKCLWKSWVCKHIRLQRLPLTRALKGFFLRFKPAVWWTSINVTIRFHALAKWRFFPRLSSTHGGRCRRLSRFYIILLQDVTPLHVKITRSVNLLRFCRRKIKLSTYLHTVSNNHVSFLNTRSQLVWVLAS